MAQLTIYPEMSMILRSGRSKHSTLVLTSEFDRVVALQI